MTTTQHLHARHNTGVALLQLCLTLQSEKDGIPRPALGDINNIKELDPFTLSIQTAAADLQLLSTLEPLRNDLSALGKKLEEQGEILSVWGADYSRLALAYVMEKHGQALVIASPPPHAHARINADIALLQRCSDLQSEKDGVARPAINEIDTSKQLDQFAIDLQTTATALKSLLKLEPLMTNLNVLWNKLEDDGKTPALYGSYSHPALARIMAEHGLPAIQK